jgi:hypothetical protein
MNLIFFYTKSGDEMLTISGFFCHGESIFIQMETTAPPPRRKKRKKIDIRYLKRSLFWAARAIFQLFGVNISKKISIGMSTLFWKRLNSRYIIWKSCYLGHLKLIIWFSHHFYQYLFWRWQFFPPFKLTSTKLRWAYAIHPASASPTASG